MSKQAKLSIKADIIALHNEAIKLTKVALDAAVRTGELLTEQKTVLGVAGKFTEWTDTLFAERMCRMYLLMYQNRDPKRARDNKGQYCSPGEPVVMLNQLKVLISELANVQQTMDLETQLTEGRKIYDKMGLLVESCGDFLIDTAAALKANNQRR